MDGNPKPSDIPLWVSCMIAGQPLRSDDEIPDCDEDLKDEWLLKSGVWTEEENKEPVVGARTRGFHTVEKDGELIEEEIP